MSTQHRGNLLNEITFEEHDGELNAQRVNVVAGTITASSQVTVTLNSTPTLFAVVNTSAAGQASVVIDSGRNFIGLATVNIGSSNATLFAVVNTAAAGQASIVLDNSLANIGFATVKIASNVNTNIGLVTVDGGRIGVLGNVTLSDPKTFIGLTTTTLGASPAFIGLVTLAGGPAVVTGNVASEDADSGNPVKVGAKYNSTMPTYTDGDRTDLQAGARGELKVNIYNGSQVVDFSADNADGASVSSVSSKLKVVARNTVFNGSTWDRMAGNATGSFVFNVGTTKTLIPLNASFAQASVATIAVPTATFNITSLILNSNATVGMRVKSGATYLIGNVSLSVMLNPGGGWVQHGSVDSPVYKGLAAASAIVLEKEDFGQVAEIAGHLIYFDE
jgi:hypothetical protein